jgi:hypothetical protein
VQGQVHAPDPDVFEAYDSARVDPFAQLAGPKAFVGNEQELAEVRWVDLAETVELMGGTMFEPVRNHLRNT